MAERNDVNIKVGVTGAKKALDELTKVLDSYSKKEKAQQQLAHQAEINQLKQKEANTERLHKGRMLKEAERFKQALNNARIESVQLTNRLKMIENTAKTEATLADQAAKSHKAKNSQIQSDLNLQHATQRAILETTTRTAEATARQEVATLRVAKAEEDVARAASRSQAATFSREAAEVRLQAAIDKSGSQAQQNALREQNLAEALNNTRIRGINLVSSEERKQLQFTANEERKVRREALAERIANARLAAIAENQTRARAREADRQADRAARIDRQQQGFFGGILSPAIGGAVEAIGRASLAFMILGNTIRPVADLVSRSLTSFAQYTQTMQTLETVTRNTGISFLGATQIVNRFNDGLSNRESVAAAVRNFSSMGLSLERQSQLIDSIRDGIVAMGGDVNEQLPLMALAIKRNSSELLDNMGITKNVDEMYKEYAASIHKTVKELNQQEKDTAVINGVLQELQKYSGIAANSQQQLAGRMASLNTHVNELGVEFGRLISGPGARLIGWIDNAIVYWGRLGRAQEGAIDDLGRQLSRTNARLQYRITGQESIQDLQLTLRAVNREINAQMAAGMRPDAPIMVALHERGRQVLNAIATQRNAEREAEKRRRQDAQAAADARLKDDEARQQILVAKGKQFEAEQLQAFINFEKNKKDMKLELAQQLFDAEMALAKQHEDERLARIAEAAERERKRSESEAKRSAKKSKADADRAAKEAKRARDAQIEREYREGVARGATAISRIRKPTFGTFRSTTFEAPEGATLAQQQQAELKSLLSSAGAMGANQNQLAKLKDEMARVTVLPKSEIDRMKKQRDELEKTIKQGQEDTAEHQRKLDDINNKIRQEEIKDTADFLVNAYNIAFSLVQGDWMAVAAQIGNTLKDSIIKSLSETKAVQDAIKPLTDALATAIAGIIKGISAFVMANPIVLLLAGLSAGVAAIMMNAGKAAEEQAKKIQDRVESIERLIPKVEKTTRTERQEKLAELQADLPGLRKKLAEEEAKRGTRFFNKAAYDKALYAVQVAETGVIRLSDAISNDLNDPLSDAAKAAKAAGDAAAYAAENMKKQAESTQSMREFATDLEDKIFAQRIDQMVREGKMTEEEGRRQKENRSLQNESMDLYTKARDMAKGFVPGSFGGIEQSLYSEAFQKFQSGDIVGMEAALRSMGIDPMEQSDLIKVWKNIEEYLTGKKQDINMPGSSPDKPMYTQVVNVRDFREAFPDSAYFRAGSPMMNSSASVPMNSNTASSRTGSSESPAPRRLVPGRGASRSVFA